MLTPILRVAVAVWVGGYDAAISRVVLADAVASILLAAGLIAELRGGWPR